MHTGDLGYFDEDGYLYLVDRKKDMINRGGYNVYSIEVESALYEHPDVVEAAVVGVPHDVLGQDVCAVVRVRGDSVPLDLDTVRAFLADRLADYKLPRRLVEEQDRRLVEGQMLAIDLQGKVRTDADRHHQAVGSAMVAQNYDGHGLGRTAQFFIYGRQLR